MKTNDGEAIDGERHIETLVKTKDFRYGPDHGAPGTSMSMSLWLRFVTPPPQSTIQMFWT